MSAKKVQPVTAANRGDIFDLAASRVGDAWRHETGMNAALSPIFLDLILGLLKGLLGNCSGTGQQVQSASKQPTLRTRLWLRREVSQALQAGRRSESVDQAMRVVLRTGATSEPDEIEAFRAADLAPEVG